MEKKTRSVSRPARLLAAVTAVVVVLAMLAVLFLNLLPSSVLEFDITKNDLYGVSRVTTDLLDSLEDPIEVRVFSDPTSLDEHFVKFMEKYEALSPKVTVTIIDPVKNPSALTEYDAEKNTVQVRNAATGAVASFKVAGFDGQDAAAVLYDYTAYYRYGSLTASSFDAEGRLAGAIGTVTGAQNYTIYYMAGHGESVISTSISSMLDKANYVQSSIELLTAGEVPEDCDLLVCNAPTSDLTADELSLLERWLAKGGRFFLILDSNTLPNFSSLLAVYGIQTEKGYLADPTNMYNEEAIYRVSGVKFGPYCFAPVYNEDSALCEGVNASGMVIGAVPLTLTTPQRRASQTEWFMSSSSDGVNYYGQDDSEIENAIYYCGVTATEPVGDEAESRLTVITSSYFLNDTIITQFSTSNTTVIMNAIKANFDGETGAVIGAKSMGVSYNALQRTAPYSLFFLVIVPVAFLVVGLVTCLKRRKQ